VLRKKLEDSQNEVTRLKGELSVLLQQQEHASHTATEVKSLAHSVSELGTILDF
jgi:hypothetical protein